MMRATAALCMLLLLLSAPVAEGRYRMYNKEGVGHQVTLSQAICDQFKERLAERLAGGPAPAPLATGVGSLEVPIRGRKLLQDEERRAAEAFILSR
jgi:hypothetical protein